MTHGGRTSIPDGRPSEWACLPWPAASLAWTQAAVTAARGTCAPGGPSSNLRSPSNDGHGRR
eukprot:2361206-Pyramimonas_sp.AAC.1